MRELRQAVEIRRESAGLVKFDDLLTEVVAAGLFLPVALGLQNTAGHFLVRKGRGWAGMLFLCFSSIEFMLFISVCMLGVLLLGYSFYVRSRRRGVNLMWCWLASAAFIMFTTIMSYQDRSRAGTEVDVLNLHVGFTGSVLASFGLGLISMVREKLWERWPEEYVPIIATSLICIAAVLCHVCGV